MPEFHYRWEWQLRSSPEALWPFITDTNRFNRDTGLPVVGPQLTDPARPLGTRRLRFYRLGIKVEFDEEPFEWIRPHRFGVKRHYLSGPVAEMKVLAELEPRDGGTHLVYRVWATPRNALGLLAIPGQIGLLSALDFARVFRRYDELAAQRTVTKPALPALELPPQQVEFTPGGRRRLAALEAELRDKGADPSLLTKLIDVIRAGDDITISRLRPYALADYWNAPRRAVLELCLWATRVGLLNFQWDVLCPLCRGAKDSASTLGTVKSSIHCESCNIDFTANFDRSVELTFRPNPAIRAGVAGEFCVGGPQVTPHILAQQILAPNEQRDLTLPLEAGRYRLRTRDLPGGQFLWVTQGGDDDVVLVANDAGWPTDEPSLGLNPALRLHNATARPQLFILERMTWSDQAVTAAEVTAIQTFRDLFATEALRPGEQISVGSLTVLFTDLRDSTRLYRESGDAVAFGRVMSHFDILRDAIAAEDGALVKTIGDAVMAVFRRPVAALHAVTRAQEALAASARDDFPLRLKAGIHVGPCVAVTLNDRLDYFGTTVNLASRLEGLSAGREGTIISSAVRHDPEVAEWLQAADTVQAEAFTTAVKGFADEVFELWVVREHGLPG
jgi:class 3 adenylate cyclase